MLTKFAAFSTASSDMLTLLALDAMNCADSSTSGIALGIFLHFLTDTWIDLRIFQDLSVKLSQ